MKPRLGKAYIRRCRTELCKVLKVRGDDSVRYAPRQTLKQPQRKSRLVMALGTRDVGQPKLRCYVPNYNKNVVLPSFPTNQHDQLSCGVNVSKG
jgi:hypothetical protein